MLVKLLQLMHNLLDFLQLATGTYMVTRLPGCFIQISKAHRLSRCAERVPNTFDQLQKMCGYLFASSSLASCALLLQYAAIKLRCSALAL